MKGITPRKDYTLHICLSYFTGTISLYESSPVLQPSSIQHYPQHSASSSSQAAFAHRTRRFFLLSFHLFCDCLRGLPTAGTIKNLVHCFSTVHLDDVVKPSQKLMMFSPPIQLLSSRLSFSINFLFLHSRQHICFRHY